MNKGAERAIAALRAGNRALLRATEEQALLEEMCRVIVEVSGYVMAWVGYAEHNPSKTLRIMAFAGIDAEPPETPYTTWADNEEGHTTAGAAIRSGRPSIGRNLLTDAALPQRWREEAARRGYAAVSSFPLIIEGEVIGNLTVFAADAGAFDEAEVELLGDLAEDLAFGIATLRLRTRHEQAEETIRRMAYFDLLTGLPNRARLKQLLAEATAVGRQQGKSVALLVLDIDRFREINDVIGYAQGDRLLQALGPRIASALGPGKVLAHLGMDEFAVVLPRTDAEHALEAAHRIGRALEEPFEISGLRIEVRASMGIALFPGHGTDPELLILRADAAMYQARRARTGVAVFQGDAEQENVRRLSMVGDLRRAIEENELLLYCQPKVEFRTRRVCGAEALSRWCHPSLGMVSPDQFIPLAEHTGLIQPLTHWVLNTALGQCYAWREHALELPLAVNLSVPNLRDPRLLDRIGGAFTTWGAKPDWLQVELTESSLMEDPAGALEVLERLSRMGIKLYVDDFGTGYSSLTYLQRLPVDAVKIDKSFVTDLPGNRDSLAIVRSTIEMAHNLGLEVVAEGVETREIWDCLLGLGCDVAQGELIAKPFPVEDFPQWRRDSPWNGDSPEADD